jgi:glycosyltransferase involved in cell wall biosynthesis
MTGEFMRIAQISTPYESTPPGRYGGTERIVSLLTEELQARGHDVTLFATGDSQTKAKLHAFFPQPIRPYDLRGELMHAMEMLKRADEFDIIHNHLEGVVPFAQFISRPLVTTIHSLPHDQPYFWPYINYFKDRKYVALSRYHRSNFTELQHMWVVNNSIRPEEFPFSERKEGFLLFVGSFAPHKGADIAIEVARRLNQKLIIIAKAVPLDQQQYYETKIAPFIDGKQICYLGEMGEERKEFMHKAKCVLFPTRGDGKRSRGKLV